MQHLQIAVDVQAIFTKQIAEALIGGGAEARDAGELAGHVGDGFDVGMNDQIRRQPGQRIAQDRQLDAAQPRFDGHRPAAGDLHAAAEQRGDVHGAAVDVEQLAFEAVLGEDAAVLGDPEKRLGGVDRRVGNAQLVGGEILSRKREEADQHQGDALRKQEFEVFHGTVDTAIRPPRSRACTVMTEWQFLTTRKTVC